MTGVEGVVADKGSCCLEDDGGDEIFSASLTGETSDDESIELLTFVEELEATASFLTGEEAAAKSTSITSPSSSSSSSEIIPSLTPVESMGGSSKDSVGIIKGTALTVEMTADSTGEEGVDDGESGASLLDVTPLFSVEDRLTPETTGLSETEDTVVEVEVDG